MLLIAERRRRVSQNGHLCSARLMLMTALHPDISRHTGRGSSQLWLKRKIDAGVQRLFTFALLATLDGDEVLVLVGVLLRLSCLLYVVALGSNWSDV